MAYIITKTNEKIKLPSRNYFKKGDSGTSIAIIGTFLTCNFMGYEAKLKVKIDDITIICYCCYHNPPLMSIKMTCLQVSFLCPPISTVTLFYATFFPQCLFHLLFFFFPPNS